MKKDSPDTIEYRLLLDGGLVNWSLGANHFALVLFLACFAVFAFAGFYCAIFTKNL